MQDLQLETYLQQFKETAKQTGLTATNPETMQTFIAGLTKQTQQDVVRRPIYGYRAARNRALESVQIQWLAKLVQRQKQQSEIKRRPAPEQELQPNQAAAKRARMEDCQVQDQSAKDVVNQHTQSPLEPKEQITKKAQQAAEKRATFTDPLQRLKRLTKVMTRQQINAEGLKGPSKEQAIWSGAMNTQVKFSKRLANLASLRATNSKCVYLLNRQSMTV